MLLSSFTHTEVKHSEEMLPQSQPDPALADSKEVLLTGLMKVLDWSDVTKPKCIPCKLVLLVEMGVHKLEIYMPPKVSKTMAVVINGIHPFVCDL